MIKRWIDISFQLEGIHAYPDAPLGVDFLKYPHRHIFYFYVQLEVSHNERDVEFILFKRQVMQWYSLGINELNSRSCETIAEELIDRIKLHYPGRDIIVKVYEDDENGAILEYTK